MTALPIDAAVPEILAALQAAGAVVIEAAPGSGKTTRVPIALADACGGEVWVLEPRRIAARAAARWVAAARGSALGDLVGYRVRHDKRVSRATRLCFVTEGVLVRRLCEDPFLDGIAAVVLDEFHERHVESDLALAMLREVRETVRPDLKLCVMSATLEAEPILGFLEAAHVVVPGRLHAIETLWDVAADRRPLELRVAQAVTELLARTAGHVLAFLPGVAEIRACERALHGLGAPSGARPGGGVDVLPLYGSLPADAQDRCVLPGDRRKVVLATNVAESSITIDGVTAVVDSGLARVLRHDAARGFDALVTERVSRASADQRRGRAGRTAPGVCRRLWTRGEERWMAAALAPEIARVDPAGAVLAVAKFAARPAHEFAWLEAPAPERLARAEQVLRELGAVDALGRVTAVGERMLALPLPPRLARVMVEARRLGCVAAAAGVAAILTEARVADPRVLAREARDAQAAGDAGDEPRLLRLLEGLDAPLARTQRQIARIAGGARAGSDAALAAGGAAGSDAETLTKALLAGFPDRVARRRKGTLDATLASGSAVVLAPGAVPDACELLLALDARATGDGRGHPRVALALPLARAWLEEIAPEGVRVEEEQIVDAAAGRVRCVRRTRFLGLVLEETRGAEPSFADVREPLLALLRKDPRRWLGEQRALEALRARVGWLRAQEEVALELPPLDDDAITELAIELCDARGLQTLSGVDLATAVHARWPTLRATLAREAPERLRLPSGHFARVDYAREQGPTVSARLQDFFGMSEVPRLAGGRVAVVVELLAPNMRPVQVTRDLASFWRNVYPKVRSELARRYPKHAWPAI